jgi:4,5-DOPA dioxygenase extradiol
MPMTLPLMPVAFIGHGTPMNALENNRHTDAWRAFAASIPKPTAILVISAHWYTRGIGITAMDKPKTIHDFGGFPQALFDMQYPAPGDPVLARRVQELLKPLDAHLDQDWGLDHGAWSILVHLFPDANIPVVQLSIDGTQPPQFHYDVGKQLRALRDEGVLILGSGNVVHNLGMLKRSDQAPAYDWAVSCNDFVRKQIQNRNHAPLINYNSQGEAARLSIPTPEHYLPALYILGLQSDEDQASILTDGIDLSSISMLSFAVGA